MGNSNNKMTRSCVPSSTGSDKNVKTMDERIDALVLRLHEVFLLSRSSRFIKPVRRMLFVFEFSNILKDFSPLKVVSVSSSFEGVCLEDHRCSRSLFKQRWSFQTGRAGKAAAAGWRV
jgi:hypothetical protein